VIAVENNQPVDVGESAQRPEDRIPCAARRILDHGDDVAGAFEPPSQIGRFTPDDQDARIRPRPLAGTQHAGDHGNPGDSVQWFGER
jgi:hypothetical protein